MAISAVRITLNGSNYNATYNSGSGKWEATLTAPGTTSYNLPNGYYPVTVRATNTAGTFSEVGANDSTFGPYLRLVVKETVSPTIHITSPGAGAHMASSTPPIRFQLRDEPGGSGVDIATLSLALDGTATYNDQSTGMDITLVSGGYDVVFTPQSALADGEHTVAIDVTDHDGNAASQATRSFLINTTVPALNIISPLDGLITPTASLVVSGVTNDSTAASPATITITLNGQDQGLVTVASDGAFSKTITLTEGENTIVVTATDSAERESSATLTVTLDTSVPEFTSISITPNPADAGATVIISVGVS